MANDLMHYDPKTPIARAREDFNCKFTYSNNRKYGRQFKLYAVDFEKTKKLLPKWKKIASRYDNVTVELVEWGGHWNRSASLHIRVFNKPIAQ